MNRLQAWLHKKIGPMEAWQWTALVAAFAVAIVFFQRQKTASGGKGGKTGTGSASDGQFNASTSSETTNPVTGDRYSNQYQVSGDNSSVLSPGALTYGAGQMPYSGGDVYVNYPGNNQQASPSYPLIHYPPANPETHAQGIVGQYWYTPQTMDDVFHLVSRAYGMLPEEQVKNPQQAMDYAIDYSRIMVANPQIDWTSKVPKPGEPLFIPPASGSWQNSGQNPPNTSQNAPASYKPPMQTTTVQTPQ